MSRTDDLRLVVPLCDSQTPVIRASDSLRQGLVCSFVDRREEAHSLLLALQASMENGSSEARIPFLAQTFGAGKTFLVQHVREMVRAARVRMNDEWGEEPESEGESELVRFAERRGEVDVTRLPMDSLTRKLARWKQDPFFCGENGLGRAVFVEVRMPGFRWTEHARDGPPDVVKNVFKNWFVAMFLKQVAESRSLDDLFRSHCLALRAPLFRGQGIASTPQLAEDQLFSFFRMTNDLSACSKPLFLFIDEIKINVQSLPQGEMRTRQGLPVFKALRDLFARFCSSDYNRVHLVFAGKFPGFFLEPEPISQHASPECVTYTTLSPFCVSNIADILETTSVLPSPRFCSVRQLLEHFCRLGEVEDVEMTDDDDAGSRSDDEEQIDVDSDGPRIDVGSAEDAEPDWSTWVVGKRDSAFLRLCKRLLNLTGGIPRLVMYALRSVVAVISDIRDHETDFPFLSTAGDVDRFLDGVEWTHRDFLTSCPTPLVDRERSDLSRLVFAEQHDELFVKMVIFAVYEVELANDLVVFQNPLDASAPLRKTLLEFLSEWGFLFTKRMDGTVPRYRLHLPGYMLWNVEFYSRSKESDFRTTAAKTLLELRAFVDKGEVLEGVALARILSELAFASCRPTALVNHVGRGHDGRWDGSVTGDSGGGDGPAVFLGKLFGGALNDSPRLARERVSLHSSAVLPMPHLKGTVSSVFCGGIPPSEYWNKEYRPCFCTTLGIREVYLDAMDGRHDEAVLGVFRAKSHGDDLRLIATRFKTEHIQFKSLEGGFGMRMLVAETRKVLKQYTLTYGENGAHMRRNRDGVEAGEILEVLESTSNWDSESDDVAEFHSTLVFVVFGLDAEFGTVMESHKEHGSLFLRGGFDYRLEDGALRHAANDMGYLVGGDWQLFARYLDDVGRVGVLELPDQFDVMVLTERGLRGMFGPVLYEGLFQVASQKSSAPSRFDLFSQALAVASLSESDARKRKREPAVDSDQKDAKKAKKSRSHQGSD